MNAIELLTPILEGGIYNTNFFNGRLLTAEDLRLEQEANSKQHMQIGQAIGEGVAYGMEVSIVSDGSNGNPPIVHITKGLALNRRGKALVLPEDTDVALYTEKKTVVTGTGHFAECELPELTATPTGIGTYILVAAPASGYDGRAPVSCSDKKERTIECGRRYSIQGVRFRLVKLDIDNPAVVVGPIGNELRLLIKKEYKPSLSKFRNLLAFLCLNCSKTADLTKDLLHNLTSSKTAQGENPLDILRSQGFLTYCDIPLALIYWPDNIIRFIDMWSVRRRINPLFSIFNNVTFPVTEKQIVEAEASFFQFQIQIAELTNTNITQSQLEQIEAGNYFRYLPAVGVIPERTVTKKGLDYLKFFNGLKFRNPVFINGAQVQSLFHSSLFYEPIDVQSKELIWLYRVRENRQQLAGITLTQQPYLIFANGHILFKGDAQYNLARWNYSNYGPGLAAR
ncbi:MAG: hypothetical protein ACMUIU_01520 [bacterium]